MLRLPIPATLWTHFKAQLLRELPKLSVDPIENLQLCVGALISEKPFKKVAFYLV